VGGPPACSRLVRAQREAGSPACSGCQRAQVLLTRVPVRCRPHCAVGVCFLSGRTITRSPSTSASARDFTEIGARTSPLPTTRRTRVFRSVRFRMTAPPHPFLPCAQIPLSRCCSQHQELGSCAGTCAGVGKLPASRSGRYAMHAVTLSAGRAACPAAVICARSARCAGRVL